MQAQRRSAADFWTPAKTLEFAGEDDVPPRLQPALVKFKEIKILGWTAEELFGPAYVAFRSADKRAT